MKKIIFIVAAILTIGIANGQTRNELDVPAVVRATFSSLYPDIILETWKNDNGNYRAEFNENKSTKCVTIDAKGNLMVTNTKIEVSALPKAVCDYLTKNYAYKKISAAYKVTDSRGNVTFKAEVKKQLLVFDAEGTFVNAEEKDIKKSSFKIGFI